MYDLNFQDAHQRISRWEEAHPENAMGPTSQATAYLFSELARLGALESELFVDNGKFRNRERLTSDPEARRLFMDQIGKADDLAKRALAESPADADALLAESITLLRSVRAFTQTGVTEDECRGSAHWDGDALIRAETSFGAAEVKRRLILYEEDRLSLIRPLDTFTAVTDPIGG
jgi:hypothetical protein